MAKALVALVVVQVLIRVRMATEAEAVAEMVIPMEAIPTQQVVVALVVKME
jgi:hypothetical protein